MGQTVKNSPATQETWVRSLSGEDPLEKGTATHSSILAWRIPRTEEPGDPQDPWDPKELDTIDQLTHIHTQGVLRVLMYFSTCLVSFLIF